MEADQEKKQNKQVTSGRLLIFPVELWLQQGSSTCPSLTFHLALAYCSIISILGIILLIILLAGITAGLLHPEFLVTTGFLKPENILIDFTGGDEEEEDTPEEVSEAEAARRRKAYAINTLLGRQLEPMWAGVAVAPLGLGARSSSIPSLR